MLSKLLAFAFIILIVMKLVFRPQFSALRRWFDGVVNAMLIAIALAYCVQLVVLLSG